MMLVTGTVTIRPRQQRKRSAGMDGTIVCPSMDGAVQVCMRRPARQPWRDTILGVGRL